jgi:hypothetical protein
MAEPVIGRVFARPVGDAPQEVSISRLASHHQKGPGKTGALDIFASTETNQRE